ncbi:hypothetical protein LBE40_04910 [Bartonella taylorii]|nr:hypothetical protein [Bartonella taylorii]USP02118.1 hypothetical protein LBE40_04910 [Bartonella taylorii]
MWLHKRRFGSRGSPSLTDEELARLKPAKDVLPPSFFKYVTKERRKRG